MSAIWVTKDYTKIRIEDKSKGWGYKFIEKYLIGERSKMKELCNSLGIGIDYRTVGLKCSWLGGYLEYDLLMTIYEMFFKSAIQCKSGTRTGFFERKLWSYSWDCTKLMNFSYWILFLTLSYFGLMYYIRRHKHTKIIAMISHHNSSLHNQIHQFVPMKKDWRLRVLSFYCSCRV